MAASKGALDGLFVLDLSRILAGPTATQMLGDLGATVIKVENPKTGGDDTRGWGPNYARDADGALTDLSAYFMAANRNKLSVAVDLTTEAGQDTLRQLAARADVVVENYKPDGLVKYGLDHATLLQRYPGLVYCSISGFGQTGPNRAQPGYDLMAQGYGGIMSLTGAPDGAPMKVGVGIADVMCGMYATIGILAALRHRDRTGQGQHIDLSLVDAQMAWLVNEGTNYLTSGQVPERRGNAHPNIVPYDAFECSDGHVLLAVGNDAQFARFCDAVGLAGLSDDPRFDTNQHRIENRAALMERLSPTMKALQRAEVMQRLHAVKVPVGPIHNVAEALGSDQAQARGAVVEVPCDGVAQGHVRLLGNPLKLSATPVTYRHAPPSFGQDTDAVLQMLRQPTANTD
ncbi:CaiB/BaiF CoA transferase family protein [Pseudosulfitobacter pseudonitzschiae]|uniref:CaiB/BaiF CoA transferase family protein n=1 Tax=Pseudosulfitobacter pseudonitzschiae TaxID=1402135 RepID=UPI001AFC5288|nr:CoA transferase [Pseudosulfitobacter pseudonitzschiae]MBM1815028.1 CoA transferase [Pseudosulfitobacter pseudonitzschiae]MBM1832019.1 CoA transferase [Pseudosulfitobacter pseudonitzschiae]MBM1836887.1 CoA transferase [Pseudosulfitobacter pseudonitzschiae]MBM1841733.1 CoA transferase [Pseudosulfitobacter pseudonitzschiae]MBM1846601.1 CoA transferase [Pseudosulfitobacter pseudonitzschiae]